jgi:hypothetical protein
MSYPEILDLSTLKVNGQKLQMEREVGSIFDFKAGDLIFSEVPGAPTKDGLVYDYREPSVLQIAEMLERDGKALSLAQVLAMPIIGAGWLVVPGSGNSDHSISQWAEELLRLGPSHPDGMQTPMESVIAQMTEAFWNRRSYHEKVLKTGSSGTQVVYDKIAWRPADSCTLLRDKNNGDLGGFTQWVYGKPEQQVIPMPYAHVYIHGQHRNPMKGISDLTVAYHNYRAKEKLKFLWFTYCEVMSLPRTVVLANGPTVASKAAKAIAALKTAGVVGMPKEWINSIQPLPTSSAGAKEFQEAIAYLDSDSSMSLLANFMDLPSRAMGTGVGMQTSTRGSNALSQSAQDLFFKLEKAWAMELQTCVTNSLIADLVRWNKGSKVQVPQFLIGPIQQKDLQDAFIMLGQIATSMSPLKVPTNFVEQLVMIVGDAIGMNSDDLQQSLNKERTRLEKLAESPGMFQDAPLHAATNVGAKVAQRVNQSTSSEGQQ